MSDKPLFLLTNDDGIEARGLEALHRAVAPFARVQIVAPDGERSAVGHAITVLRDMPYRLIYAPDGSILGHALDATPADCVKLALTHLFLEDPPAFVISGVNSGANLGNNILYSGTVSAAREAAMLGFPAIAVSIQRRSQAERPTETIHFDTAAAFAARLALRVLERDGLPPGVLLNVNVPNLPAEEVAGVVVTRQGASLFVDKMFASGENGRLKAFRNVGDRIVRSDPAHDDCDDIAVDAGKISVSPLRFDLTHEAFRAELERWINGF